MQNVDVAVNGNTMVITIDLTAPPTPSASGKTQVIATTRGNQEVAPDIFLGLNCYYYTTPKRNRY